MWARLIAILSRSEAALAELEVSLGNVALALETAAGRLLGTILGFTDTVITIVDYNNKINYYKTQINPDTNELYTQPEAEQKAAQDLAPQFALLNNNIEGDVV